MEQSSGALEEFRRITQLPDLGHVSTEGLTKVESLAEQKKLSREQIASAIPDQRIHAVAQQTQATKELARHAIESASANQRRALTAVLATLEWEGKRLDRLMESVDSDARVLKDQQVAWNRGVVRLAQALLIAMLVLPLVLVLVASLGSAIEVGASIALVGVLIALVVNANVVRSAQRQQQQQQKELAEMRLELANQIRKTGEHAREIIRATNEDTNRTNLGSLLIAGFVGVIATLVTGHYLGRGSGANSGEIAKGTMMLPPADYMQYYRDLYQ
jgi:ABC-type multidrug transport system fused ATPase/permease subunit